MDLAAGLTYRTVFAMFPALLAIVSILGLVGQGRHTTNFLVDKIAEYGSASMAKTLEGPIDQLASGAGAGPVFIVGVLGAVWTASNYVVSFGKAMNTIYGVQEGRPALQLRLGMYVLTLALLIGVVMVLGILVFSGSVVQAVGDIVGLGAEVITVWTWVRWPVLVVIVILLIASLYYFTPNVRRYRFPWLSVGAMVALVVLGAATTGFGFYLANFANYNKTYGSIGGVIALLMWLWIANSVLLLGAEVDAETERAKQLQAGIAAEDQLQLPARSASKTDKAERKRSRDVYAGRELRAQANPITADEVQRRSPWRRIGYATLAVFAFWRLRRAIHMRDELLRSNREGQESES
jgi:membrane protein